MLLEEVADDGGAGSPTFAPTAALADGAALTAVADAIGSLSAAQLGGAVAGEVNKTNDDVAIFRRRGMARISLKVSRDARKRGGGETKHGIDARRATIERDCSFLGAGGRDALDRQRHDGVVARVRERRRWRVGLAAGERGWKRARRQPRLVGGRRVH
jgi:hypothetical protein